MSAAALRARYVTDSVSTASPQRLVAMLYDALVRDLLLAENALSERRLVLAHERLVHAQAIVTELRGSLDLEVWDGAQGLAALYDWVTEQLVDANVRKDAAPLAGVHQVVEPLRDAWHQVATGG